jgi:hypothetical protein
VFGGIVAPFGTKSFDYCQLDIREMKEGKGGATVILHGGERIVCLKYQVVGKRKSAPWQNIERCEGVKLGRYKKKK